MATVMDRTVPLIINASSWTRLADWSYNVLCPLRSSWRNGLGHTKNYKNAILLNWHTLLQRHQSLLIIRIPWKKACCRHSPLTGQHWNANFCVPSVLFQVCLFNVRAAPNDSKTIRFLNFAAQGEFNGSSYWSTVQSVRPFLTIHCILWALLAGWQRNVTFSSPSWRSIGFWAIFFTALPRRRLCATAWLFAWSRMCL